MQLEYLKVWHWMLIGLLVGAGLGYWQVQLGPNLDRGVTKTIYQEEFERRLFETYHPLGSKPEDAKPVFAKIVVHPIIEGKVWITGVMVDIPTMRLQRELAAEKKPIVAKYVGFRCPTDLPYKPRYYANVMDTAKPAGTVRSPLDAIKPPAGSVVQYLQKLKETRQDMKAGFAFAWWETRPAVLTLWTAGSFLIIGCLWPVVIQMLIGAGFAARPKESAYDLDRFKGEKAKVAAAIADAAGEQKKLDDLNAAMEARLAGFAGEEDEELKAEMAEAEAKVRALPTAPLDGGAGRKESSEPVEYTGEFYPVVKAHQEPERK